MTSGLALLGWVWFGCALFLLGCAWRALRYVRAPEHLRWDLYPVAHEPRRAHGGSYFEEKDWWTKPRVKSLWGEVSAMGEEILLLRGVWKNNPTVWWASMPFHWGLYLLMVTSAGLLPVALGFDAPWLTALLRIAGAAGGALLAAGAAWLLVLRSTSLKLRRYTAPVDRINLALLAVIGALSAWVAALPGGMASAAAATGRMLRFQDPQVSVLLGVQMALATLFLVYLPFTRMVHFFAKYFIYHEVRWDDRPVVPGSVLERRLRAALDYGVAWSAEHVQTGKSWAEVASEVPGDDDGKGGE